MLYPARRQVQVPDRTMVAQECVCCKLRLLAQALRFVLSWTTW